jgi:tripartite-type tricarboxylate transporter receptor subunit TctC
MPDFQERLATLGATPRTGTPAEFNDFMRAEVERYAKIVKSANVVAD